MIEIQRLITLTNLRYNAVQELQKQIEYIEMKSPFERKKAASYAGYFPVNYNDLFLECFSDKNFKKEYKKFELSLDYYVDCLNEGNPNKFYPNTTVPANIFYSSTLVILVLNRFIVSELSMKQDNK